MVTAGRFRSFFLRCIAMAAVVAPGGCTDSSDGSAVSDTGTAVADAANTTDGGSDSGVDPNDGGDAGTPVDGSVTGTWPIERVTLGDNGLEPDGGSFDLQLSPTGRYALFRSAAMNLRPNPSNAAGHIYLRDRQLDTTTMVSLDDDGEPVPVIQDTMSMSDDRTKVVFKTQYAQVTPGGSSNRGIFLRDLTAETTRIVSLNNTDEQANGSADTGVISGNGEYVAFTTTAINMGPGSGRDHVYVRDLDAAATILIGQTNGEVANQATLQPDISDDGQTVVFMSQASNLPSADGTRQVYVTTLGSLTPQMVSVNGSGEVANATAQYPAISGDGRFVAFYSTATNLVPGADDGFPHVYLRDTMLGTTVVASVDDNGQPISGAFGEKPGISDDGRYVSFITVTPGTASDTNASTDTYVFDRESGTSARASLTYEGAEPTASCFRSVMSGDGSVVGFMTISAAMVADKASVHQDGYAVMRP